MIFSKDLFMELVIHQDAEEAIRCMEPLFKWIGPEMPKSLALYTYARRCKVGPIIELGAWHGQGTIALALGARDARLGVQVITIDSFTERPSWVGGAKFFEDDYDVFQGNIMTVGVENSITLICKEVEDAIELCDSYELLFWDIGGRTRLMGDYLYWKNKCDLDGLFIVKDTGKWDFGFPHVAKHAVESGRFITYTKCTKGYLWSMGCVRKEC